MYWETCEFSGRTVEYLRKLGMFSENHSLVATASRNTLKAKQNSSAITKLLHPTCEKPAMSVPDLLNFILTSP
jgi:hypothetical protein